MPFRHGAPRVKMSGHVTVILRPFTADDIDAMGEILADPDLRHLLLVPAGRDRGIGSEATRLIFDHAFL